MASRCEHSENEYPSTFVFIDGQRYRICNSCIKAKPAPEPNHLQQLQEITSKHQHPDGKYRFKHVIDKSETYAVNDKDEMLNLVLWVAGLANGQTKIIVKTDMEEEIFNVNYPLIELHCPNCNKWYEPTVPSKEEATQGTNAKEQWMTGICSDKCWTEFLGAEE